MASHRARSPDGFAFGSASGRMTGGLTTSRLHDPHRHGARMHLHFAKALLPEGWRSDVVVTISGGTISTVTAGPPPPPDAGRFGGIAIPGLANVHSHAFQRAMAGLAERQGA